MDRTNINQTEMISSNIYANDFGIIDFMDEPNFDHFIDLIRDDNEVINPIVNFSNQSYVVDSCDQLVDHAGQLFSPIPQIDLFDLDHVVNNNISMSFGLQNEYQNEAEEKDDDSIDEDGSSETTTTNTSGKKNKNNKVDRSRTLISERKRRSRMKEKLYALRALVPNITKMDKASIVGDAVLYVQDLQMKAKKLKTEIAALESIGDKQKGGRPNQNNKRPNNVTNFSPIIKKIYKMDVYEVEESGYYVRILCKKEKGVAVLLFRAIDSVTSFNVRTSNLAASTENYVFTFTLHRTERETMNMNLPNLKMWIASVFINQGFDFETISSS